MKCFRISVTATLLLLTLAACGGEDSPASIVSGSLPISSAQASKSSSSSNSTSSVNQTADEDKIREIIIAYGAKEKVEPPSSEPGPVGKPNLIPTPISLFYSQDSWGSPAELSPGMYFSWFFSTTMREEYDYKLEAYKHPKGEDYGYLFPQELYEARVQKYFEVSADYLRSDPQYYNAELKGYIPPDGGGKGESPLLTFPEVTQEGDLLTITTFSDYKYSEDITHILTVKPEPDGGWKYQSCQVIVG